LVLDDFAVTPAFFAEAEWWNAYRIVFLKK
jgi:hypothetical protein